VHDPSRDALAALTREAPAVEVVPPEAVATADIVFLALHPPALLGALGAMQPLLAREAIVVSLAPKIPLATLETAAGSSRIVRMIPNAPSLIGRGYNPVTYGAGVDDRARTTLAALFAPWGRAPEVPEPQLEGYAILTGMGPTYFWFQWQALRTLVSGFGLSSADADTALRAMVDGALTTLLDAGLTPEATIDLVPVRPLSEAEPAITNAYRTMLPALYSKIRPAEATVV
jgi:pyrroline-5-carboxylate reductase